MKSLNDSDGDVVIPMAPMIDVVFQLLIFFLVGTTFFQMEKDLTVRLPGASAAVEPHTKVERLTVNIRRGGELVVDQRRVSHEELARELAAAMKRNPQVMVILRGDRQAYHEDVVRILNECLLLGIHNVSIAVYPIADTPG